MAVASGHIIKTFVPQEQGVCCVRVVRAMFFPRSMNGRRILKACIYIYIIIYIYIRVHIFQIDKRLEILSSALDIRARSPVSTLDIDEVSPELEETYIKASGTLLISPEKFLQLQISIS